MRLLAMFAVCSALMSPSAASPAAADTPQTQMVATTKTPTVTTTGVALTSLSVDRPRIAPAGVVTKKVTFAVGLRSTAPLAADCIDYDPTDSVVQTAFVQIKRVTPEDSRVTGHTWDFAFAPLALASGSATNGVWTAALHIPSTWTGTWQIAQVHACGHDPDGLGTVKIDVDPRTIGHTVSFTVAGTHLPNLYMRTTPNPVPWNAASYTWWGRVYDTATGVGVAGADIQTCGEAACFYQAPGPDGMTTTGNITDSLGYVGVANWSTDNVSANARVYFKPLGSKSVPALVAWPAPAVLPGVTAAPASTMTPAAQPLTVDGRFFGTWGCAVDRRHPIQIQYLYGRTAWRLLATTTNRPSGRWTAVYPARAGRTIYRAYHPAETIYRWEGDAGLSCAAASSAPFVVTGT